MFEQFLQLCIYTDTDAFKLKIALKMEKNQDFISGILFFTVRFCFRYASNSNLTGLCRSSQLKVADFSFNFFVGNIPKCLEYLPRYFPNQE